MRSTIRFQLLDWVQRLRSPAGRRRSLFVWAGVALWIGTEVVGRRATSEFGDLLAVVALVLVGASFVAAHRIEPFDQAQAAYRWLLRTVESLQRWRVDVGIDLRGEPELPRRVPDIHYARLALVLTFVTVVVGLRWLLPWRQIAAHSFYTPLAVAQAATWLVCLGTLVGGARALIVSIRFALREKLAFCGPRRWMWPLAIGVGATAVAITCSTLLPAWIPLIGAIATCVVVLAALRGREVPTFALVWRGADRGIRSLPFHAYAKHELIARFAYLSIPLALALGTDGTIRLLLGNAVAWVGSLGIASGAATLLAAMRACHRDDPARQRPATVHVDGEVFDRDRLEVAFRMRGLRLRPPGEPAHVGDVRVALRTDPVRADERGWPWPASRADLADPEFIEFLARHDAAMCRSEALDAIEQRLDFARTRNYARGTGYWLAPHQWAFPGLVRDEPDATTEQDWTFGGAVIGRPWRDVMRPRARHHLWVVLCALDVDLLFVEDDVSPRSVRSVFEMLFDRCDWTPHARLEHHDLRTVAGVRLMLHETPSARTFDERYPEPDYDDVGRARVLHLFRDRTDESDLVDAPSDDARMPVVGR